jgi:ribonuclease P protein component
MRLRSRQRLRRQSDFAAVRQEGRRQFGAAFVFAARRRPPDPRFELPRFAVVASRRVGNAVMRNLLKRRLREIFRAHQTLFPGDTDVIVTLQPKASGATFAELEKQFLAAARRCKFGSENR